MSLLTDTLRGLLANPTFGNQTELLKKALDYAILSDGALNNLNLKVTEQGFKLANLEADAVVKERSLLEAGELVSAMEEGLILQPFAVECHANSVAHGWHDKEKTFGDYVALIHSEVSEALEAFRAPGEFRDRLFSLKEPAIGYEREPSKPEGVLSEFADVVIRILDYTESIKATGKFIEVMRLKHEYNKSRPFRHGGKQL